MSDNAVAGSVLIFLKEIFRARKRYLRDIFFYLIRGHADTVILNRESLGFFVYKDVDTIFFVGLRLGFAHLDELFELRDCVYAVGDDFAEEDILIGIKPFFYNGHHIFA